VKFKDQDMGKGAMLMIANKKPVLRRVVSLTLHLVAGFFVGVNYISRNLMKFRAKLPMIESNKLKYCGKQD
jgi:uncharacterized protein YneF (UPF0154 family)